MFYKVVVVVVVVVSATLLVLATIRGHREHPSCWEEDPHAPFGLARAFTPSPSPPAVLGRLNSNLFRMAEATPWAAAMDGLSRRAKIRERVKGKNGNAHHSNAATHTLVGKVPAWQPEKVVVPAWHSQSNQPARLKPHTMEMANVSIKDRAIGYA